MVLLRVVTAAAFVFAIPGVSPGQATSVLHIKVSLLDAEQKVTPVPRHALLISDNPPTAVPRRIVTKVDGTADVNLRPGNYTVESDQPVAFHGKAYQWTQMIDIVAGRDAALDLTADNAEVVEPAASAATRGATPLEADPAFLLPQWQDSVAAMWTAERRGSGFVFDARGLVATNQRLIGSATTAEVQFTPTLKVAGRVLTADSVRDVAVLWIDPTVAASVRSVPLGCAQQAKPSIAGGQEIFAISAPLREQKGMTSATVSRVEPHSIASDLTLATGSTGGPVFAAAGAVIGITSIDGDEDDRRRADAKVVRIDDVCDVVASAEKKMDGATPPSGARLPVEPMRPFPEEALKDAAQHRAGSLNPYQMSTSAFDVAFITPVMTYGAEYQSTQASGRNRQGSGRTGDAGSAARQLTDFSTWSEYVADFPPVLLVRVTPKLVEGFWTTVARGAARTQGIAVPPIKHFRSGFSQMRAFCGDTEVVPIHPFKLEQRISDTDAIHEGLYVFGPGALGPQCGSVKLVVYSEKEPEKGDTRVVDPTILQRIWQDFAPYRELKDE
jgi:S1-C subfamily serine protease